MSQKRLLIIEDEEMIREALRLLLEEEGLVVDTVETLGAAKEALKSRSYDLVISDCVLPDGLACDLFDNGLKVPTLVMTGYVDKERLQLVASHPYFVGLLPKPFELKDLVRRVKEVICRCEKSQSQQSQSSC